MPRDWVALVRAVAREITEAANWAADHGHSAKVARLNGLADEMRELAEALAAGNVTLYTPAEQAARQAAARRALGLAEVPVAPAVVRAVEVDA